MAAVVDGRTLARLTDTCLDRRIGAVRYRTTPPRWFLEILAQPGLGLAWLLRPGLTWPESRFCVGSRTLFTEFTDGCCFLYFRFPWVVRAWVFCLLSLVFSLCFAYGDTP